MKEVIGKRIRKIRESKDYSQENIAVELNMTTSAYSKIERGVTDVPTSKLIRIAEILEIDVVELFIDLKKSSINGILKEQVHGFATKGDIVELLKTIQKMMQDISDLKDSIRKFDKNI